MKILLISQYYPPEEVGIGVQLHQLTTDLQERGHQVRVLTAFPNYPGGLVFPGFQGRLLMNDQVDGVEVRRTYIHASQQKTIAAKALNFASFCLSSFIGGLTVSRPDVIYCVMPPLPLGLVAHLLGVLKRAPVVVNVQDIYPDIAIELGILRHPLAIRVFKSMERLIYRWASGIVVISDGFRDNLLRKMVPKDRVHVVPNWVDPGVIRPGPKANDFRSRAMQDDRFTLTYSGSLSYNSNLEPVIAAAGQLRDEEFSFLIVGDGVHKRALEQEVREAQLSNVTFLPFQPLETYPEVLTAADMNLVTLNSRASMSSVPSKVIKIMASGRPVLAITSEGNDLHRLVIDAECGLCVPPDDPEALVSALRYAASHPLEIDEMGAAGRRYFERHFSRQQCVDRIERVLQEVARR